MSYYYNYYLGYKKDGKIFPLGPYNHRGTLMSAISRSRSFASDLHEEFRRISEDEVSDELRKQFEYENYKGEKEINVKKLMLSELPAESYIKSGYFLIEDVEQYEKTGNSEDLFYESKSPSLHLSFDTHFIILYHFYHLLSF